MLLKIISFFIIISNPWLLLIGHNSANLASQTQIINSTSTLAQLPVADSYVQAVLTPDYLPIRNWAVSDPQINAKSAIVFDTNKDKTLWQSNINEVLPIASLTKLMTAAIAIENIKLDRVINVSKEACQAPGDMGGLKINEKITVKTLLYALLMESSNDAAMALAEAIGKEEFVKMMNAKALQIGMANTVFTDPSGVSAANVSTVSDLVKLIKYDLQHKLIWEITSAPVIYLRSADGQYDHRFINNNQLLSRVENIIGGKTGYTSEAMGCMILVTSKPSAQYLISIVLGSDDRMLAIEKLVIWAKEAFFWQ